MIVIIAAILALVVIGAIVSVHETARSPHLGSVSRSLTRKQWIAAGLIAAYIIFPNVLILISHLV